jgi:Xaa-Pro aminopeptidase
VDSIKNYQIIKKRVDSLFNLITKSSVFFDYETNKSCSDFFVYLIEPTKTKSISYFLNDSLNSVFYTSILFSKDNFYVFIPDIEKNYFLKIYSVNDGFSNKKSCQTITKSYYGMNYNFIFYSKTSDKINYFKKIFPSSKKKLILFVDGDSISFSQSNYLKNNLSSKINKVIELCDVSEKIRDLRLIKNETEISNIKQACKIASKTSYDIPNMIKSGITELKLKNLIDNSLIDNGAISTSFDTVVGFGLNSSLSHPPVSSKKLKSNSLILLDFGARHKSGYVSDMSRTIFFGKKPNKKVLTMYDSVFKTVKYVESLFDNTICGDSSLTFSSIQKKCMDYIQKNNFLGEMNHSVGHSIGLDVHDGFAFGMPKKIPDVFLTTIEPGLYHKSIGGIRIENDYLYSSNKLTNLTKKSLPYRNLLIIKN